MAKPSFPVIITSYEIAQIDRVFLQVRSFGDLKLDIKFELDDSESSDWNWVRMGCVARLEHQLCDGPVSRILYQWKWNDQQEVSSIRGGC